MCVCVCVYVLCVCVRACVRSCVRDLPMGKENHILFKTGENNPYVLVSWTLTTAIFNFPSGSFAFAQ